MFSKYEWWQGAFWKRLEFSYSLPILLGITDSSASSLQFSLPNGTNHLSDIPDLSSEDCRAFCCKDCTIYLNIPRSRAKYPRPTYTGPAEHMAILRVTYDTWFPIRDPKYDLTLQHFFAPLICSRGDEVKDRLSLSEITSSHRQLCKRVKSQLPNIPDEKKPSGKSQDKASDWKLTDTFERVFIVIDQPDWAEIGVLLVVSDRRALDLELIPKDAICEESNTWRISLVDAILTVVKMTGNQDRWGL